MLRIPIATYRLQFNSAFTFQDARRIVPYLANLGITDIYSSPLLRPRKGSTHGYDIVDANALNPELGTDDDLKELQGELDRYDMGLLLDIVPNHMAASHENAWWNSVLENGQQSRFVHYFDIDWRDNRVLLPILGRPYGETLESHEIQLAYDADGLYFSYFDKRLPLAPQSYLLVLRECVDALPVEGSGIEVRDLVHSEAVVANSKFVKETLWRLHETSPGFREALSQAIRKLNGTAGVQESFNALDAVLDAQHYRLAYWRIASETINYRRFFDVTDLVGLRVENPEVFEMRNRRILDLIAEGTVTGLRIDHIDGLYDPVTYLLKLQHRLGDPATVELDQFYVVVEKILQDGEPLRSSLRCSGTTGYDFIGVADAVFIDPDGLARLTTFYESYTGLRTSFEEVVYERKKQVIEQLFSGEMRALGAHLGRLAVADRNARDFAPSELLSALVEITACLPVYRTYAREGEVTASDWHFITDAIADARRRAGSSIDDRLFTFLELVLLLDPPHYIAAERPKWLDFVMKWQQFTGRVMAKGVEDTAFYAYNRLVSLNEVGSHPGRSPERDPVVEFHSRNTLIARDWPLTMNATSTHDTKRSEDVRARISVISELADVWQREVWRWRRMNAHLEREGVPDANDGLLIYQTLAGVWPLEKPERKTLDERLRLYLEKAAREAKRHTSWLSPDIRFERSLQDFAIAILDNQPFMESFLRLQRHIAFHGHLNALSELVLKVCSPGVPDFYQGSEIWDFSLVDPDNRRPVEYETRARLLRNTKSPAALLRNWKDGRLKLFVMARSLATRARRIDDFQRGTCEPVDTGTPSAIAFLRNDNVLVVVPRLTTRLVKPSHHPIGDVWGDLALPLSGHWTNAFTGETVEGETLLLREIFATFPVAILERRA